MVEPLRAEPSQPDAAFDRWVNRLKVAGGMVLGAFLAGVFTLLWGDARYVRRDEFQGHSNAQQRLEEHAAADRAAWASKADLVAHVAAPGHPQALETNRVQNARLRHLEQNQAWIVNALWQMSKRAGVQLPAPPPMIGPGEKEE